MEISYHPILVKDLVSFSYKIITKAKPGDFVPISDQRAKAMANNPAADPNDVAMMVAFLGDVVVGYFGIMPILLWHKGEQTKIHWFTTWTVSPKVRGQGVGAQLMAENLKLNLDFMIVGSKPARILSKKFGFKELPKLQLSTLDIKSFWRYNPVTLLLRLVRKILLIFGKKILIEKFVNSVELSIHKVFGGILKKYLYTNLLRDNKEIMSDISWKKIETIPAVPSPDKDVVNFYRDQNIINWMLIEPWVVKPGTSRTENMDFYFSDVRDDFSNNAIEIFRKDYSLGFITFQYSNNAGIISLRIEDVLLKDEQLVYPIACMLAKEYSADNVTMNGAYVERYKDSPINKFLISNYFRTYQYFPKNEDSPLGKYWEEIQLNLPDGDMGFS